MKILKTASGKKTIKMSKSEWTSIGKKAGWMKISGKTCPKCGEDVWDTSNVDQRLNKCWKCGLKFMNDTDDSIENNEQTKTSNSVKSAKKILAQENIDEIRQKKTDENVKLCWEAGSAIINLLESDSKDKFISNDARYTLNDARSICDSLAEVISGEMSPYENRNLHQ